MTEQEFAELAAGYALGALSAEDLQAFETARAVHPEWERHVQADLAVAAELADTVDSATPPPAIRASLLAQIATTPQRRNDGAADDSSEVQTPDAAPELDADEPDAAEQIFVEPAPTTSTIQAIERRNWSRGLFGLAASLLLLVGLGLGAASLGELFGPSPAVVALQEIEGAPDAEQTTVEVAGGGTATVHWSNDLQQVVLVSDGLPEIAEDQAFELWFVRGDEPPIAAGTFVDEEGTTTALLDGRLQPGDLIAVTVEEAGGSPTGEPTTDPILAAPTA